MYYFELVDNYCATTSALIIGLTEVVAVTWVYGTDKYMNHIKEMIDTYPEPYIYWKVVWKYICPLIIAVINHLFGFLLIVSLFQILLMLSIVYKFNTTLEYNGFNYPFWTTILGWFLASCSVVAIPIVALYYLIQYLNRKYRVFKTQNLYFSKICFLTEYKGYNKSGHRLENQTLIQ